MDFFERQEHARRRTALLVAIFVLAVLAILAAVLGVAWGVLAVLQQTPARPLEWLKTPAAWVVAGIVLGGIAIGSLRRWIQLSRGGGDRVATLMGGRLIDPDTRDSQERMLVNVVEEMAIASGLTVPNVYILDHETTRNAFAAGLHPGHAVVAVTRGLLEDLDRDQLQGVVAHEFSHILNGDMRLNLRLLALLAGITLIGEFGAAFWRGALIGNRGGLHTRPSSRRGGDARALFVLLTVATALVVIGWLGVFAGRVIKAAVSRQREFLADAAAIQFTRHPDGLGGALVRIAVADGGSTLRARHAEEISHMGFARTVGAFSRLTATHPPIEERIDALGPKYRLWFDQARRARRRARFNPSETPGTSGGTQTSGVAGEFALHAPLSVAAVAGLAGRANPHDIDHARALLNRLPASVRNAVRKPQGAQHAVLALLLEGSGRRSAGLAELPPEAREEVVALRHALEKASATAPNGPLDATLRLPVLELAMPALRCLSSETATGLLQQVDTLIRVDARLSVFEYTTRTLLVRQLFARRDTPQRSRRLLDARSDVATVLSVLAHAGSTDEPKQASAYAHAMRPLFGDRAGQPLPREQCTLAAFDEALRRLDGLRPMETRALMTACADCVAADDRVHSAEAELLRLIGCVLEAPLPAEVGLQ